MIVAIQRPDFFPCVEHLDQIAKADLLIILDHVQYEHTTGENRMKIKTEHGSQWFSVPLVRASHRQPISEKIICNDSSWQRKIMRALKSSYQMSPYFDFYAPMLWDIFGTTWHRLLGLNMKILRFMLEAFDIRTKVVYSSELGIRDKKTDLELHLCRQVGADALLCSMGGPQKHLDAERFERVGTLIMRETFKHPRYVQYPNPKVFIEGLSAVDMLFNCGPNSERWLRYESGTRAVVIPDLPDVLPPRVYSELQTVRLR